MTLDSLWLKGSELGLAAWGRTSRRMRMAGAILLFLALTTWLSFNTIQSALPSLPSVSLEYQYQKQASKFNESKVALLIENRANPILAPLMLHFISVVPPDWRFRFMGSFESVEYLNQSVAIRSQVAAGKLDLTYIPANMTTASGEEISRFLTTLWLYEVVLQPAEWLLIFQTDSILCANSRQTINDYLEYDWVGAPWDTNGRYGGNGGLSLRRVSAMIDILRNQVRVDGSEPEDVWLTDRLGHRPGSKMANGTISATFSGEMHSGKDTKIQGTGGEEDMSLWKNGTRKYNSTLEAAKHGNYVPGLDDWRDGFYEPMGYHTGSSGTTLHGAVWGTPEKRKHIWDYCPEVKMTLQMDVAAYVPGGCGNGVWKRGVNEPEVEVETEVIDGVEYPLLRGLVPW
ncbi:hypothetical protein B0T19DRAFT_355085 [Cercophora scortea]|uniref:DUF5672 domain-containing protein n=1 Tax=Cercophora scortea TaxID=314031 RepID=A0AAE0IZY2_9PEZI|nr:hypothetical protein B0T19DRAFT_355085 [Cercophora scortea]